MLQLRHSNRLHKAAIFLSAGTRLTFSVLGRLSIASAVAAVLTFQTERIIAQDGTAESPTDKQVSQPNNAEASTRGDGKTIAREGAAEPRVDRQNSQPGNVESSPPVVEKIAAQIDAVDPETDKPPNQPVKVETPPKNETPDNTISTSPNGEWIEDIPPVDIKAAAKVASSEKSDREFLKEFLDYLTKPEISELAAESEYLKIALDQLSREDLPAQSIFTDPDLLRNFRQLIEKAMRGRVQGLGTRKARSNDHPECVAVGSRDVGDVEEYYCTGTLIAKNIVLTAGHCVADSTPDRIFIGNKVGGSGITIAVISSHLFDFDLKSFKNDLALLILEKDAPVSPAKIAPPEAYNDMASVRVVGFGNSGKDTFGTKRLTHIPIASRDGSRPRDIEFGCNPPNEFVAAAPKE